MFSNPGQRPWFAACQKSEGVAARRLFGRSPAWSSRARHSSLDPLRLRVSERSRKRFEGECLAGRPWTHASSSGSTDESSNVMNISIPNSGKNSFQEKNPEYQEEQKQEHSNPLSLVDTCANSTLAA